MPPDDIPEVNQYEPVAAVRVLGSGRTKPIEMICRSIDGNPNDDEYLSHFVVKLKNDLPYNEHSCARELIGSLLAKVFGLLSPDPAIIVIPEDFWEIIDNSEIKDRIRASSGYNFGSRNVEINALVEIYLPRHRYQEGADIFAFDALIQNPDRRTGQRNMFSSPDGFILYDHELAFPFSRPYGQFGGFPNPWELMDQRFGFMRDHIFYRYLKSSDVSFENHYEKLRTLDEKMIDSILSKLPDSWIGSEIRLIKDYLMLAHNNADKVKRGLQEVLA